MFYTSSAGAVASLILMCRCSIVPISMIVSLCFINIIILSLTGATNTFAVGSVSLSVSSNTVDLSITPTRVTGTFAKSDNISISASTNNSTGYTLMLAASSSTDYDKLKNTTTNTSLSSISSATTEESFKALNGTAYNGKWGYLPSKYCTNGESNSCTTNTDFLPAPIENFLSLRGFPEQENLRPVLPGQLSAAERAEPKLRCGLSAAVSALTHLPNPFILLPDMPE